MKYSIIITFGVSLASAAPAQTPADSSYLRSEKDTLQQRSTLSFNPDIGVIGDFQGFYKSTGQKNVDAYLNETEMSFQSVVDPYVRADFFISLSRDRVSNEYGVDVEEGFVTTLSLPARLQIKAGKFKQAVGRINTVHAHTLPFVDLPVAYTNCFGEEGLSDEGVSVSWLLPTVPFYQELIFETTTGYNETTILNRGGNNQLLYLAHLKNVFTLTGNSTLQFGITGISGPNNFNSSTYLAAGDITYKWKPVQMNTYRSLTWQSEFFYTNVNESVFGEYNSMGFYSFVEYQLARRWFLTGRYDYAQWPLQKDLSTNAVSLTGTWEATEFQRIQLEGKVTDEDLRPTYFNAWLRWIFIIGAHGAHKY